MMNVAPAIFFMAWSIFTQHPGRQAVQQIHVLSLAAYVLSIAGIYATW